VVKPSHERRYVDNMTSERVDFEGVRNIVETATNMLPPTSVSMPIPSANSNTTSTLPQSGTSATAVSTPPHHTATSRLPKPVCDLSEGGLRPRLDVTQY